MHTYVQPDIFSKSVIIIQIRSKNFISTQRPHPPPNPPIITHISLPSSKWKSFSCVWLFVTPGTSPWYSPGQNIGVGSHSLGEGNGTPLQYSCLENPRDGGAWWAAIYGVTQSRTRLMQLSSSSFSLLQGIFPTQGSNPVSHIAGRFFIS